MARNCSAPFRFPPPLAPPPLRGPPPIEDGEDQRAPHESPTMPTPPLHFADMVRVLTRDTGAGPLALGEALPGHRSFAEADVPVGTPFHYAVAGIDDARHWEVGVGERSEGGRLIRRPTASSDSGALVAFAPGRKAVSLTVGAEWFAGQGRPDVADVSGLAEALDARQPRGDYAPAGHTHPYLPLTGGSVAGALSVGSAAAPRSTLDVRGYLTGGLGALALSTALDWNGPTMARSGMGEAALRGNSPNGPGGNTYFYSLTFEQGGSVDGSGAITQFAIPRSGGAGAKLYYRLGNSRLAMDPWRAFLVEDPAGRFAGDKDNANALGSPAARFTQLYAASGAISTSDARDKADIGAVPDDWLDAWEAAHWRRYRFAGGRRWHIGLVAQAVRDAFAARGLDAAELGLLCHDAWPEERADGEVVRPAGDRWGLRYEECLAIEAACTRRRLDRIEAALGLSAPADDSAR